MKIVVDVPDEEYESYALAITFGMGSVAIRRILNGTPLPKGHGRIGDLDEVEKIVCDEFVDLQDGSEEWRTAVNDAVENILHKVHYLSTIIEADKEGADND